MATLPHHDVPRRGTRLYLKPRADIRSVAKPARPRNTRPSAIQRMTFIFGASAMLWVGIAALVVVF